MKEFLKKSYHKCKHNYKSWVYPLALFIVVVLVLNQFLFTSKIGGSDTLAYWTFVFESYRENARHGDLPLWTEYYWGGDTLFANPAFPFFDLSHLILYLVKDTLYALNLIVFVHALIGTLGMYFLIRYLSKNENQAFVGSIAFLLCGYNTSVIQMGFFNFICPIAFMPLFLLFVFKAIDESEIKNYILYSIFAAIFLSLQFLSGGTMHFFFSLIAFGIIVSFNLVFNKKNLNLLKGVLIIVLVGVLSLGLIAVKYLPSMEYTQLTSRAAALPYEEHVGQHITSSDFSNLFFKNDGNNYLRMGIVVTLLALLGLSQIKKIKMLVFVLIALFALLIATASPLSILTYNYFPGFNRMRHLDRILILFALSISIIASFGYAYLENKFFHTKKHLAKYFFAVICILIFLELLFVAKPYPNLVDFKKMTSENRVVFEIAKENSLQNTLSGSYTNSYSSSQLNSNNFRIWNAGLVQFTGSTSAHHSSFYGIQNADPGGNIWINDVIFYNQIARQYDEAKAFANLNVKYIISDKNLTNPNYKYLGEYLGFEGCGYACGPYLYENQKVMPRAYVLPKAVLVLGHKDTIKDASIKTFIFNNYDLTDFAIISSSKSLNEFSLEELARFNNILLAYTSPSDVTQDEINLLYQYKLNGGVLIPDIFEAKDTASIYQSIFSNPSDNQTSNITASNFSTSNKGYDDITIISAKPNELKIKLDGQMGFLVLSEKYKLIPGWKAKINGEPREILLANYVISSVYLNGEKGELVLSYWPNTLTNGLIIFTITLFMIVLFIGWLLIDKKQHKENTHINLSNSEGLSNHSHHEHHLVQNPLLSNTESKDKDHIISEHNNQINPPKE